MIEKSCLILDDHMPVGVIAHHLKKLQVVLKATVQPSLPELQQLLEKENFDLVVIGNNMGAGIKYARLVPERLKSKTIIIWNQPTPEEEARYLAVGINRFDVRIDLMRGFAKALGVTHTGA